MVIGRIGADRRPMVPVVVQGAGGQEAKISCLLSTGFREALLVPPAEAAALHLPQTGTRTVEFPDGSRVEATVHPAQVLLGGEAQAIDLLVGGHEPRLGLALFENCRLRIAFTEGGAIEMERP